MSYTAPQYVDTKAQADLAITVSIGTFSSNPSAMAYRKVSGAWQQVALDKAFTSGTNYKKE